MGLNCWFGGGYIVENLGYGVDIIGGIFGTNPGLCAELTMIGLTGGI